MAYACSYEVPASLEMYQEVRRLIGDEPADGRVAHVVVRSDGGLRHWEIWESEVAWRQFHTQRVEPAVHAVLQRAGFVEMPPEPATEELDVIDIALGP